jgi:hypothetical protein
LKPSDSAPVLQYESGPSSDFLYKLLGVKTQLFLCYTQLYFPLSSLLFRKSHKSRRSYVVSVFAYYAGGCCSLPSKDDFLITMSVMALGAVQTHLLFNLFSLFLLLLTFELEISGLGLL